MSQSDLISATIVATPTGSTWSQAYHAGKLFAVLSLTHPEGQEKDLAAIGKTIISILQEEYFSLEHKDLIHIKQAIETTRSQVPKDVTYSLVVASLQADILYIFIATKGVAFLKRNKRLVPILKHDTQANNTISASGRLLEDDLVILATQSFTTLVSQEILTNAGETPTEIAESLSPLIHEQKEGQASALIFLFKTPSKEDASLMPPSQQPQEETAKTSAFRLPFPPVKKLLVRFGRTKLTFLVLAILLIGVLAGSVMFSLKQQENAKDQALLESILEKAQVKYEEGNELLALNENLAKEDFQEAKRILDDGKEKLTDESRKKDEFIAFEKKLQAVLGAQTSMQTASPKEVLSSQSLLLSAYQTNNNVRFTTQDETFVYTLESNLITSIDKQTQENTELLKNDNNWEEPGGLGVYNKNLYVLDKKDSEIIKFAPTQGGYGATKYLQESADFSTARSMAIDGSVWVLLSNGSVLKFTRGKKDAFSLTGLDKPLLAPTSIATGQDLDHLYILDNGNSRIVVFDKNGVYKTQYSARLLKDVKGMEVREDKGILLFLSGSKQWELQLQ